MARALRIERPDGRYHITARGNERKPIFREERDYQHFLQLAEEATGRFGIQVHAYVLMANHYHLLVQTPEANLSRALQWLNVSYSVWFNRRHRRVGHLFQGRFKAVIVEDEPGWQQVARYVHLNPVRLAGLRLDKRQRAADRLGLGSAPSPTLVTQRLEVLRQFRWSSYRAYAGYCAGPNWLCRQPLDRLCGGQTPAEQRAALRAYTEGPVRQGVLESPWSRLIAGVLLGSQAFAQRLRRELRGNAQEQTAWRQLQRGTGWTEIIAVLEKAKAEPWEQFSQRHGDWGRDAALWLGRRRGRYTLGELGVLAGGISYVAVGQAVSRFGKRLERDRALRQTIHDFENKLSNI